MADANKVQKIVAPVVGRDEKTWWMPIGISGVKNGQRWGRLNAVPTGKWDGYFMIVDDDRKDAPRGGKGGKAEESHGREDAGSSDGPEEVPF